MTIFYKLIFLLVFCFSSVFVARGNDYEKEIAQLKLQINQQIKKKDLHNAKFLNSVSEIVNKYILNSQLDEANILIDRLNIETGEWNNYEKGVLYLNKAILLKYYGANAMAKKYFLVAEELIYKTKNKQLLLWYFIEIADFDRKLANFDAAEREIFTALSIFNKQGSTSIDLQIHLFNRLAAIFNEIDKKQKSIYYSKKAIALAEKYHKFNDLGVSYTEIGFTYKNLYEKDTAEYYYLKAANCFLRANCLRGFAHAEYNRCILYYHNGYKLNEAKQIALNIENMVITQKVDYPLDAIHQLLCEDAKIHHNLPLQLKYLELYHNENLNSTKKQEKSSILLIEKEFFSKKLAIEKEKLKDNFENSIEKLRFMNHINFLMIVSLIFLIIIIGTIVFFGVKTRKLNKQLLLQDSFNKRMMTVISHDLKGSLYLLSVLGNKVSSQVDLPNETLKQLNHQIQISNEVLDSLLNWLKSCATLNTEQNSSNLETVWEITKTEQTIKISEKNIEIITEVSDNPTMELPSNILNIAIRNLLSNAIKYSYDHSSIVVRMSDNVFQIQDFGIGIEADRMNKLFASDIISTNGTFDETGLGIGLYMAYNLLLEYNFKIFVTCDTEEGTTFTITKKK